MSPSGLAGKTGGKVCHHQDWQVRLVERCVTCTISIIKAQTELAGKTGGKVCHMHHQDWQVRLVERCVTIRTGR